MAARLALAAAVAALLVAVGLGMRTGVAPAPGPEVFDFPVGAPDGRGYYDAQPFGTNDHLGDDWNGNGGGDTDLGDPVTAIGDGVVTFAEDVGGGWGNVVRVRHREVESLYAHLDRIDVAVGEHVLRRQQLGTLGDAHGRYQAHLHLEIRARAGMPLGPGYARGRDRDGYLDPTAFIRSHHSR